jgi:hypothetical protein
MIFGELDRDFVEKGIGSETAEFRMATHVEISLPR